MEPKVKRLSTSDGATLNISECPNFSVTGSITGMRKKYLPKGARLVICGAYVYNVDTRPDIYEKAT